MKIKANKNTNINPNININININIDINMHIYIYTYIHIYIYSISKMLCVTRIRQAQHSAKDRRGLWADLGGPPCRGPRILPALRV